MDVRSLLLASVCTVAAFGLARQWRRLGPLDLGLPLVAFGVAVYLTLVALVRLVARQLLPLPTPEALLEEADVLAGELSAAPAEQPAPVRRRPRRAACTPRPPG